MNHPWRFLPALLALGVLAANLGAASAQGDAVRASDVKAAFLFNFAKFVEWPAETVTTGPLVLCVSGDTAVAEPLETMVRGKRIQHQELAVRRIKVDGALDGCNLLYVPHIGRSETRELLARLKGAPVFSISDSEHFASLGGVANFFMENNRIRFAINPAAAQRFGLRINSQVLGLARIVKEEHGQ